MAINHLNRLLYDSNLNKYYPHMKLCSDIDEYVHYEGIIRYRTSFKDKPEITEEDYIKVSLPINPHTHIPKAYELGKRIDRTSDNHINNNDGEMCLGLYSRVSYKYQSYQSAYGFIEDQVIPFLYSYHHKKLYGYYPYGEMKHHRDGLLQHYRKILNLHDNNQALSCFLYLYRAKLSLNNKYKGHHQCPCGSEAIIRNCHAKSFKKVLSESTGIGFSEEFRIISSLLSKEQNKYYNKIRPREYKE